MVSGCAQCDEDVDKCESCTTGYNLTNNQCSKLEYVNHQVCSSQVSRVYICVCLFAHAHIYMYYIYIMSVQVHVCTVEPR